MPPQPAAAYACGLVIVFYHGEYCIAASKDLWGKHAAGTIPKNMHGAQSYDIMVEDISIRETNTPLNRPNHTDHPPVKSDQSGWLSGCRIGPYALRTILRWASYHPV